MAQKRLVKRVLAAMTAVGALGALLGLASPAQAYTVKGMGTCKTWVGGVDDRFWILGFLSGANYEGNHYYGKDIEPDEIYRFVTRFCKENPNGDLADASVAFIHIH